MPAEYSPSNLNGIFIDLSPPTRDSGDLRARGCLKKKKGTPRRSAVTRKKEENSFPPFFFFVSFHRTLIFILIIQINFPRVRVAVSLSR